MQTPRITPVTEQIRSTRPGRYVAALALILAASFQMACSNVRVTTDFDPEKDFSRVQTYAWLPNPPNFSGDPQLQNDLVDARVRSAVDRELAARGFNKVADGEADFFVTYYLGLESRIDVQTIHTTFRYSRHGWSTLGGTQTHVRNYEQGTMLIDVLEPAERRLVWRGTGATRMTGRPDPARRQQRIDEAVERILDRFPPS